jgi:hypothetical protein
MYTTAGMALSAIRPTAVLKLTNAFDFAAIWAEVWEDDTDVFVDLLDFVSCGAHPVKDNKVGDVRAITTKETLMIQFDKRRRWLKERLIMTIFLHSL